jgi:hypothetical protein
MTPQREKYVAGSATSVDDMRRGEYEYRHGAYATWLDVRGIRRVRPDRPGGTFRTAGEQWAHGWSGA